MRAFSEGEGVIEGKLTDYRVSSLFSDDFRFAVENYNLLSTF